MVIVWLLTPVAPYSGLFGSVKSGVLPVAKNGIVWLPAGASGHSGLPLASVSLR